MVFLAAIGALLLLAPVGLILFAVIVRLGLEESYEVYGPVFTLIAGLGVVPCLLAIGFLFDRQQTRRQP